jgi:electron transport complex protein RnfB
MCVKACPAQAVSVDDKGVIIDQPKCLAYGPECKEACAEKCPRAIFRSFQPGTQTTVSAQQAA